MMIRSSRVPGRTAPVPSMDHTDGTASPSPRSPASPFRSSSFTSGWASASGPNVSSRRGKPGAPRGSPPDASSSSHASWSSGPMSRAMPGRASADASADAPPRPSGWSTACADAPAGRHEPAPRTPPRPSGVPRLPRPRPPAVLRRTSARSITSKLRRVPQFGRVDLDTCAGDPGLPLAWFGTCSPPCDTTGRPTPLSCGSDSAPSARGDGRDSDYRRTT